MVGTPTNRYGPVPDTFASTEMQTVTRMENERAVHEARRKFRRVLCSWASDALALRRAGLDQPTFGRGMGVRAQRQPWTDGLTRTKPTAGEC